MAARMKTTRRTNAEQGISLAKRRAWYAAEPMSKEERDAVATEAHQRFEAGVQAKNRRNNFEAPRPGTFPSFNETLNHEADGMTLTYISGPAERALEELSRIAANERLTPQARNEDFGAIKRDTLADIDERYDSTLADIEAKQAELEAKARRPLTPSVDPAKLLYVRDTLQGQARAGTLAEHEVLAQWERALVENDQVVLQVMIDNAAALIRSARPAKYKNIPMPKRYEDLQAKTDEALRSPEQKKARAELLKLEATRWQARRAHMQATSRLKNAAIQGNTVVDRQEQEIRARMRSGF